MKDFARRVLTSRSWLGQQPEDFQAEVIRRGIPQTFGPGEVIYGLGEEGGGIYGLVSGSFAISIAVPGTVPRVVHFGTPGHWIGEGPFLTGTPRRVELRAALGCAVLNLPLDAMEMIAFRDPMAARRFGQIGMLNVDLAIRALRELLIPDTDRRIAAVLSRIASNEGASIPVTQSELGDMANATRKQAHATLGAFAARGWVRLGYRAIHVTDPTALSEFAEAQEAGEVET